MIQPSHDGQLLRHPADLATVTPAAGPAGSGRALSQLPQLTHGGKRPCGHKYAGHCPARVETRPTPGTTKSKAGRRVVPLPAAVDLLCAHREAQKAEQARATQLWVDQGWIFTDEIGGPINPRTDWDPWKRLLAAAGVRDGRLHDARHTAATVLLLLGVHERTIMSVLGWSTTAMASRYTHVVTPIHNDVASRSTGSLWANSWRRTEANETRSETRTDEAPAPRLRRGRRFAWSAGGGGGI